MPKKERIAEPVDAGWAESELGNIELGDKRLRKRFSFPLSHGGRTPGLFPMPRLNNDAALRNTQSVSSFPA